MDENYYNQRLEEIGRELFKDGAFFSTMPEDQRELFGEALVLLGRKGANDVVNDKCGDCSNDQSTDTADHLAEGIKEAADAIKEVIQFAKGGFININVNVTPNGSGSGYGSGNNCDDEYYGGSGTYYSSGSGYADYDEYAKENVNTTRSNLDEMINDGSYDPVCGTEGDLMYGDNMEMNHEDDGRVETELEIRAKGVFTENGVNVDAGEPDMLIEMYVNDESQAISIVKGLYYALHNDDFVLIEPSLNVFYENLSMQMDENRMMWLKQVVKDLVNEIISIIYGGASEYKA